MDADEFWLAIGLLKGNVTASAIRKLTLHLSTLSPEKIAGFHARLAHAMFQLDRPENSIRTTPIDRDLVNDDASLYYRCWLIAQGEQSFNDKLQHPGVHLPSSRWQLAEHLLNVAQKAMESHDDDALVGEPQETPFATGSNTEFWSARPPRRPVPPPRVNHQYAQDRLNELAKWRGVTDPENDAFYRAELQPRWHGFRMLTKLNSGYIETVVHFHAQPD